MFSKIDRSSLKFNILMLIVFVLGLELSKLISESGLSYLMLFTFSGGISYTCFKLFKYVESAKVSALVIFAFPLLLLSWVSHFILNWLLDANQPILLADYVICYLIALFAYMIRGFNKAFVESQD